MLHEWTFENFGKHHRARETDRDREREDSKSDREGEQSGHAKEPDAHDDDPRQCECAAQCARSSGVVSVDAEEEAGGGKECGRFRWLGCLVKSCLFVILAKNFIHDGSNTQNFVY